MPEKSNKSVLDDQGPHPHPAGDGLHEVPRAQGPDGGHSGGQVNRGWRRQESLHSELTQRHMTGSLTR